MSETFRFVVWVLLLLALNIEAFVMWEMRRKINRLTKALKRIAWYDLEGHDPLADCALRQWAREALEEEAS